MKIKEVTVGYGQTINLGHFESFRTNVLAVMTVDEDESADQVAKEGLVWCRKQVGVAINLCKETRKEANGKQ